MDEAASNDVELTTEEARVLGCLMEKSATTPDNYPLSVNALMNACNQTTNRDPVVAYDEATVERALESLRTKGLGRRVMATGQRVVKHRHVVEEALQLHVPEFAILGVLLLRGPQTPGELKQRTERWHTFRSLDDLEATLQRLADRGYARQLERRPGQKEARWLTLLVSTDETATPAVPVDVPVEETTEAAPAAVTEPAPREERSLPVRNPATGAMLRDVAVTEEREIAQKTDRARRAQRTWAARPYEERAELLRRFATMLGAEAEECARSDDERGRQAHPPVAQRDRSDPRADHVERGKCRRGDRAPRRDAARRRRHGRRADLVRTARRRRAHQRMELSVLRGVELDRAGPARRQRRAVQAVGARDAYRAPARRPLSPGGRAGGRRASGGRRRCGRVRARRGRHRHGLLHRFLRDRSQGRRDGGRPAAARAARARREGCRIRV